MSPPPYRADHIGSLIRPKYLLDSRITFKQWLESDERDHRVESDNESIRKAAKEAEQKAIADVVSQQVERGIVPITSGEFERHIFFGGFFEAVDGFEMKFADMSKFRTDFPTNRPLLKWNLPGREVAVATRKLKLSRSPYLDDWKYVRSLLPEERWRDVKITLPAPGWWHFQMKDGNAYSAEAYGSDAEYFNDVSAALRQEIMTLYDAGL